MYPWGRASEIQSIKETILSNPREFTEDVKDGNCMQTCHASGTVRGVRAETATSTMRTSRERHSTLGLEEPYRGACKGLSIA